MLANGTCLVNSPLLVFAGRRFRRRMRSSTRSSKGEFRAVDFAAGARNCHATKPGNHCSSFLQHSLACLSLHSGKFFVREDCSAPYERLTTHATRMRVGQRRTCADRRKSKWLNENLAQQRATRPNHQESHAENLSINSIPMSSSHTLNQMALVGIT